MPTISTFWVMLKLTGWRVFLRGVVLRRVVLFLRGVRLPVPPRVVRDLACVLRFVDLLDAVVFFLAIAQMFLSIGKHYSMDAISRQPGKSCHGWTIAPSTGIEFV
ncbi:MAG: hypothetical protein DHS20C20_09110 [Ardenticatenaceae bacterium]|nr:MAG: hypothetical protein DHS20C20_09110 [Ardenticatenaceae bacterium]